MADLVEQTFKAPDETGERPVHASGARSRRAARGTHDGRGDPARAIRAPDRRCSPTATRAGLAELSGTAALLELARVLKSRELSKTLVLVSTSGSTTGFAGAREWARRRPAGRSTA